jgi:stage II sporulation protein P
VLIVHTHTSEAFAPSAENNYTPSDPDRTEDENFNITRVGSEMAKVLSEAGIKTCMTKRCTIILPINGSYKNCLATVQRYLKEYPSIKVYWIYTGMPCRHPTGKSLKSCTTFDNKKPPR